MKGCSQAALLFLKATTDPKAHKLGLAEGSTLCLNTLPPLCHQSSQFGDKLSPIKVLQT